jgi:hypothetical protein
MSNLNELALTIPCPTCGSVPGDKCIARDSGAFTKKPHESRLSPMRAAYNAGLDGTTPLNLPATTREPAGPSRVREALTGLAGPFKTAGGWLAAEWRYLLAYAASAVAVFVAVAVCQHFWPNETMAAWGATWRVALIMLGAYSLVFLVLEALIRRPPDPHEVEDIYGNCLVCGASKDEPCLTDEQMADRNRAQMEVV